MFETKLRNLVKFYIPITLIIVVFISTIYHFLTTQISSFTPMKVSIFLDILVIVLIIPQLYHAIKVLGQMQGALFFFTVFVFLGSQEALWVFLGKLGIIGDAYDYTLGGLWFLGIPCFIANGWFIWTYVFYFLVKKTFSNASPVVVALLCGLMALSIDIWLDPAVVNASLVSPTPDLWVWSKTNAPKILTVPLYNFLGWFLSSAMVIYFYEITWAQLNTISRSNHPFRKILTRFAICWIVFASVTKTIQMGLVHYFPNVNLWQLGLTTGGSLTLLKYTLIGIVPVLMVICLIIAIKRAISYTIYRTDFWLLLGFTASLAFNLKMAYALQFTFPNTYLICIIVISLSLPIGMLLHYLLRKNAVPAFAEAAPERGKPSGEPDRLKCTPARLG
jgi:hypothetical protein